MEVIFFCRVMQLQCSAAGVETVSRIRLCFSIKKDPGEKG